MATGYFAHERLEAYRLALAALEMVAARRDKLRGLCGGLAGQLERAVVGAYSNLCAGAAAQGAEGRRHFRIALSEAGEAGGCARGALALRALSPAEHDELRATLLRLCACLHGLAH
jgi:four helix bundle protein